MGNGTANGTAWRQRFDEGKPGNGTGNQIATKAQRAVATGERSAARELTRS
jgi:hypothetical protein